MAKVLPKPSLPHNATMESIVEGLAEPEEYVRRVFAQMGKRSANWQVRIGITSDTEAPDYIFDECVTEPLDPTDPYDHGQPVTMAAYNGRTHRPLSFEKTAHTLNWSTIGMSWEQVRELFGRLRVGVSRIATTRAGSNE